jgi:hypothetical protein
MSIATTSSMLGSFNFDILSSGGRLFGLSVN